MKIILASSSPRRKEILEKIGLKIEIIKPEIDEKINRVDDIIEVAYLKAKNVFDKLERKDDLIVIGADTVVVVDNYILGKPKDKKDAFNMIKLLRDKIHYVYTGLSLVTKHKSILDISKTSIKVEYISDEQIKRYIEKEEILDAAGAYKIQGLFSCFIKSIEGEYYNVVGLPLNKLYNILKKDFGLDII
ncbi:MAG TPA: Maf family protein [Spirochaetota bacterium]|nr:Maf family protein [Spirochaetota bacterium]HOM37888.1 Maf family protein [Spirochaetota bacterium]HPQ48692.1 Maf family protein [Spirochaetota bacterium]